MAAEITIIPELEPILTLEPATYRTLFTCAHHRSTFLASLPWFLQDIATCGLGIILQAIRLPEPRIEQKLLHELAVALYAEDLLSLGKARELAQRTSTSLASFLPSGTSWGITGTMN